jgi:hypothetical protein
MSDPITATNLANYIGTVLTKEVQLFAESNLVCGGVVDRSYEPDARGGSNVLQVPKLSEISTNLVNTAADMTLYDTLQNKATINLNISYDIGVAVDDINQIQTNPKYFEKIRNACAYGLAKRIDTSVAALFNALDYSVGTEGSAITEDVILQAYEYLNAADAPVQDRAWIFDPESITDLMKLDMFCKMDYVGDAVWKTGFTGRQILGSPVYISTNLEAINTNYHGAAYIQKEAIALVVQLMKMETARLPLRHSDMISGLALYGTDEMRGTFGVWIKTRS